MTDLLTKLLSLDWARWCVLAGLVLVLLSFFGRIGAFIELPPEQRRPAAWVGSALLVLGIVGEVAGGFIHSLPGLPKGTCRVSGVVRGDVLWMREGPGVDHEKVASIPCDATDVQVDEAATPTKGWVKVTYGSTSGWVNASYLKCE